MPERITILTLGDFTKWLKKNHATKTAIDLVLYKRHTGKPAPLHRELLEEAICYGWIDTTLHRVDDDTYIRKFVRRNDKSSWSSNTLGYAKELQVAGRMTEQGIYYYNLGKQKPTHDHGIPKNPRMPTPLKNALEKKPRARKNFEAFTPSTKRMLYRWILSGKREETRAKRVTKIVTAAQKGERPL